MTHPALIAPSACQTTTFLDNHFGQGEEVSQQIWQKITRKQLFVISNNFKLIHNNNNNNNNDDDDDDDDDVYLTLCSHWYSSICHTTFIEC